MVRVVCGCPDCMRPPRFRVRHRLPRKLGLRVQGGWVGWFIKKKKKTFAFCVTLRAIFKKGGAPTKIGTLFGRLWIINSHGVCIIIFGLWIIIILDIRCNRSFYSCHHIDRSPKAFLSRPVLSCRKLFIHNEHSSNG